MSFFSRIASFLKGTSVKISQFFVELFGSKQAHDFGSAVLAILKSDAGMIALDAVLYVATLNLPTGDAKRQAAYDKIEKDAKAIGLQLTPVVINLLIEIAVLVGIKKQIALADSKS